MPAGCNQRPGTLWGMLARWRSPQAATAALRLGLLLVGLLFGLHGLDEMTRGLDMALLTRFLLSGLLLAWLIAGRSAGQGKPAFSGGCAVILLAGLGAAAAVAVHARLAGPLANFALQSTLCPYQARLFPAGPGFSEPLLAAWTALREPSAAFAQRGLAWLGVLSSARPSFDPVMVGIVWSLVAWSLAAWAGWFERQQRPLLALAPTGLGLAYGLYATRAEPGALFGLGGAALLLQAVTANTGRWLAWKAARLPVADIYFEWAAFSLVVCAALLGAAALTPSISIADVARAVDQMVRPDDQQSPDYAASFGLEIRPEPVAVFASARIASLPAQHLVGGGPELSRQVVMWVAIGGYTPISPQALASDPGLRPPRYYGRGLSYDRYTGRGWLSSPVWYHAYAAGEAAIPLAEPGAEARTIEQNIRYAGKPDELVYTAGELLSVDQPYLVAWRETADALGVQARGPAGARGYWATSRQPIAGVAQLRAAGVAYPGWVSQRYLALPDELPARVRALAMDLTSAEPTPFDRAVAIERYLRTYPYTLDLPDPPYGVDIVDYFLFDLRRGYCDYYASAMVVLTRAAGIPARLVTGYVGDNYDPTEARFVISAADAHSWPELYFPGIGWVGFEPTAALGLPEDTPAPEQFAGPLDEPVRPLQPPGDGGRPALSRPGLLNTWGWAALYASILTGLAVGALLAGQRLEAWMLAGLPPGAALERIYRRLGRLSRGLGMRPPPGITPLAFSAALRERLALLQEEPGQARWMHRWVRLAPEHVERLVNVYIQAVYGRVPPGPVRQRQAIEDWQSLRRQLWAARLTIWWGRLGGIHRKPRKKP